MTMTELYRVAGRPPRRPRSPAQPFPRWLLLVWLAFSLVVAAPAAAQEPVAPSVVYANTKALQAEVELIRAHLGRPVDQRAEITVRGAEPREVYFQARSLATRTSRLAFEHLRRRFLLPDLVPADEVQPADVLRMVSAARAHLAALMVHFGIEQRVEVAPANPSHAPTDVYRAVVTANRQLNQLTTEPFSPSDVWMQVTLAVSYTARLLAVFEVNRRIPHAAAIEPAVRPRDVYRRLLASFTLIRVIAERSKLQMLTIDVSDDELANIVPSDVYDLASLIVAELAYLFSLHDGLRPPVEPYRPDGLQPPDVHQRAGILEAQLKQLTELVEASPDWIGAK